MEKIPIVLLTAKGLTSDRIQAYKSGVDVFLSKPFAPEELLAIVDNLIVRMEALKNFNASIVSHSSNHQDSSSSSSIIDSEDRRGEMLQNVKEEILDIKSILQQQRLKESSTTTSSSKRTILPPSAQIQSYSSSSVYGAILPSNNNDNKNNNKPFQKEIQSLRKNVRLTETEKQVLVLLSEGYTNGDIAQRRSTSVQSVSRTIGKLYSKTWTKTRTELVRWAIEMGHISVS